MIQCQIHTPNLDSWTIICPECMLCMETTHFPLAAFWCPMRSLPHPCMTLLLSLLSPHSYLSRSRTPCGSRDRASGRRATGPSPACWISAAWFCLSRPRTHRRGSAMSCSMVYRPQLSWVSEVQGSTWARPMCQAGDQRALTHAPPLSSSPPWPSLRLRRQAHQRVRGSEWFQDYASQVSLQKGFAISHVFCC